MALMELIDDIWSGVCDFASYVWGNADLVAFLCLAAIGITAAIYVVAD